MNVFTGGQRNQPWVWQVTGLCFILGLLLAASLQTRRTVSRSGLGMDRVGVPPAETWRTAASFREKDKEIGDLRKRNQQLDQALSQGTGQQKMLNEELLRLRVLAGFTPVRGPGIMLTLQDSKKRPATMRSFEVANGIIHDVDIRQVLDELGQSGAEAVSVNGQRIVSRTYLRCVGPTVLVNSIPLVPPYIIQAIGDPDTLWGGLNLPYGVLDQMRRYDPQMFKIERKKKIEIPAYTGSTEVRFAEPAKDEGSKKEKS